MHQQGEMMYIQEFTLWTDLSKRDVNTPSISRTLTTVVAGSPESGLTTRGPAPAVEHHTVHVDSDT